MNINQLIFRNIKKNLKNYYLYIFALIFTVTIYFAFVTLQYDPSMDEQAGTIKGAAAIKTGTVLLIVIVSIFLLYANTIFIKRRSGEIALFQLIGMTKGKIFKVLSIENLILYFSSLAIGIFLGFSISKLMIMILYKITGVDAIATLHFSSEALVQTIVVFSCIYLLIMIMNYTFIKNQSILSLFQVRSTTETKLQKMSIWQVIFGILGIGLVSIGYYISQKLFDGDFVTINEFFIAMLVILASVIVGTYLFYKCSVSFILHLVRKRYGGYLNVRKVLSLSSIMFKMKSNALLLTVITTITALSIGLISLSYITFYSAEQQAKDYVVADFSLINDESVNLFTSQLEEEKIGYTIDQVEVIQVNANLGEILDANLAGLNLNPDQMPLPVVSDDNFSNIDVSDTETLFTGYSDLMQRFITIKDSGEIVLKGQNIEVKQDFIGLQRKYLVSSYFNNGGGMPLAVVDESIYKKIKEDMDPAIQKSNLVYTGVYIKDENNIERANEIFHEQEINIWAGNDSQLQMMNDQKQNMGLMMFIVGFLGLTFLVTSGCVLYFKQMDESESEKPQYSILRKLGYTEGDLISGIRIKQLFSFGIPLVIGLLHSYFAVKSGWFLFGTELWTPMLIVMVVYTILYSIFGILSVLYYKTVIRIAL
ncbi:FtsX-like permease family protein [Bacillaceae bacterium W0354]